MDSGSLSALAALAGAAIVAGASFLRGWIVHQREVRAQWLAQQTLRRQDLYKEFIEEASKCYLHAFQHHEPDISLLVVLYAKINRMRVLASPKVLTTAEDVLRRIVETYSETDVAFTDSNLKTVIQNGSFDILRKFSEECRAEFDLVQAKQVHRRRHSQMALTGLSPFHQQTGGILAGTQEPTRGVKQLSLPKTSSGADSRNEAESAHHLTDACILSFACDVGRQPVPPAAPG
jgi:hypothetical protein